MLASYNDDEEPKSLTPATQRETSPTRAPRQPKADAPSEGFHDILALKPTTCQHRLTAPVDSSHLPHACRTYSTDGGSVSQAPVDANDLVDYFHDLNTLTISESDETILMTIDGYAVLFDLTSDLPGDPTSMVLLLKRCLDRGNWMMVAAHYRRQGNLRAAERVLHAFIECALLIIIALCVLYNGGCFTGMTGNGDEFDLKPAFHFLASLYTDQAKAHAAGIYFD